MKHHLPKIIFLFASFIICPYMYAQSLADNFYIRVMQQELNRNIRKLSLPDLQKPFFIQYKIRNSRAESIAAERGEIRSYTLDPDSRKSLSVKLRVGDYHRNFDHMMYDGSFIDLPQEEDADECRRIMWIETDRIYKNVAQQFNSLQTNLKRVQVDEKELAMDDIGKITPVNKDYGALKIITYDKNAWQEVLKKLSLLYTKDSHIVNSGVVLNTETYEDYSVTSEGTTIRIPVQYVTFSTWAAYIDENGTLQYDNYFKTVKEISELPPYSQLEIEIKHVVDHVKSKATAADMDEAYAGPILIEGDAVTDMVETLFASTLKTKRKSFFGYGGGESDYEEKLGQRLTAKELTLTALPTLARFNNQSLTGFFPIDDEGVTPPDSLVLIQNGLLQSLMSTRTPTKKYPVSNGFMRSFMGRNASPGVLKLTSSATIAQDSMKAKLIQAAKEEGLQVAYIIRDNFNDPAVYKIDIKTGNEQLMKKCRLGATSIKSLRRFIFSSQELQVDNGPSITIIAPKSMLINEMEIEKTNNITKPKPIIVSNPLLDKGK